MNNFCIVGIYLAESQSIIVLHELYTWVSINFVRFKHLQMKLFQQLVIDMGYMVQAPWVQDSALEENHALEAQNHPINLQDPAKCNFFKSTVTEKKNLVMHNSFWDLWQRQ